MTKFPIAAKLIYVALLRELDSVPDQARISSLAIESSQRLENRGIKVTPDQVRQVEAEFSQFAKRPPTITTFIPSLIENSLVDRARRQIIPPQLAPKPTSD